MARKRMIDPGFWSDEKIIELQFVERLLFIGYWNFADDNGVHVYSIKALKAEIFPADDVTLNEIETRLNNLIAQNLLVPFHNNQYLFCPMWAKHQTINKPQASSNPLPPIGSYEQQKLLYSQGKIRDVLMNYLDNNNQLPECSGNVTVIVPPNRKEENKREEKGRGREETARAREGEPDPPPAPSLVSLARVFEREFGRPLSPLELEQIGDWEDQYPGDIVLEALRRAVAQGVLKLKYIDRILLQWEKANLKTLREILDYEAQFEQKKLKVIHGGGAEPAPPPETVSEEDVGAAVTYISYNLQAYLEEHPNHTEDDLRQFLNSGKFDYPPGLKRRAFEKLKLTQYLERGP